jgi:hypothetical protein
MDFSWPNPEQPISEPSRGFNTEKSMYYTKFQEKTAAPNHAGSIKSTN